MRLDPKIFHEMTLMNLLKNTEKKNHHETAIDIIDKTDSYLKRTYLYLHLVLQKVH